MVVVVVISQLNCKTTVPIISRNYLQKSFNPSLPRSVIHTETRWRKKEGESEVLVESLIPLILLRLSCFRSIKE